MDELPDEFAGQMAAAGFIGQNWAVQTIGQLVENRRLGFDRSKAPLVLVFTGPSGACARRPARAHSLTSCAHVDPGRPNDPHRAVAVQPEPI